MLFDSFFPAGFLWQENSAGLIMLFSYSLHTLDSTKKVSDVLKLFEDGEMAKYVQGDVSGSGEILSLINSSHLCF